MRKPLKHTAITLLGKVSEELATAGPGAVLLSEQPASNEGFTSVTHVYPEYGIKTNTSTISNPLSTLEEALQGGTISSIGYLLESGGGKSSVQNAISERLGEKTPQEKKNEPNVKGRVDSIKGGVKHDDGKPRTELISPIAMIELAKVLTFGAKKYEARNWEKGLLYTRVIGAILRHTWAYLRGETLDPETGLSHMAHVLCEAMFLVHFESTRPEFDNRK